MTLSPSPFHAHLIMRNRLNRKSECGFDTSMASSLQPHRGVLGVSADRYSEPFSLMHTAGNHFLCMKHYVDIGRNNLCGNMRLSQYNHLNYRLSTQLLQLQQPHRMCVFSQTRTSRPCRGKRFKSPRSSTSKVVCAYTHTLINTHVSWCVFVCVFEKQRKSDEQGARKEAL